MPTHNATVVDQFTKQALPFSEAPSINDAAALELVVDRAGAGPDDTVLDVACGPGLVVCAFARVVRHATGIDLTPAMIARASAIQAERGLDNVSWRIGDVGALPFRDASFSIVTSRFAFHHLLDPSAVLREMSRVCTPGGAVVVVDIAASPDPEKAVALNRMEKLRDPSHTRTLTLAELQALFPRAGLPAPSVTPYSKHIDMDELLQRSFPDPADLPALRTMFAESVDSDRMGIGAQRYATGIRFAFPTAILVARRPASR